MENRPIIASLGVVIAGLLLVGLFSHTPTRHLCQVAPAVLLIATGSRRARWAAAAALPIFLFWLVIMVAIWLFLLGLARIVTGHFTAPEVLLTIVVGAACIIGIVASARHLARVSRWTLIVAFAVFSVLQLIAFRVSLLPGIAGR